MSEPEVWPKVRPQVRINIETAIEGPFARVGHAPRFLVSQLSVVYSPETSDGPAHVVADIDARSLLIISADLSESDRTRILESVHNKALKTELFPVIRFVSTKIIFGSHVTVRGELTLTDRTRTVDLVFDRDDEGCFLSRHVLRQSDFGITPLTAMLGALRCKDEVELLIHVDLECMTP